jgi:4,5-dihydroxyphthalate decarboxylase
MEKGRKMAELVASGELVAAIGVESDHPDVKPLIPDARETAFNALSETGHYPINHLMVVKDEILQAHPELAPDLFRAFAESKRLYVEKLKAGAIAKPTPVDEMYKRVMEITGGDPLPYGIAPNRAALDEVIRSAQEQKILTKPVTVEELFPRNTHELVG